MATCGYPSVRHFAPKRIIVRIFFFCVESLPATRTAPNLYDQDFPSGFTPTTPNEPILPRAAGLALSGPSTEVYLAWEAVPVAVIPPA
jgi:hypothetical protein